MRFLKIHADRALSYIFRAIDKVKDDNLNWLKDTIKQLVENIAKKSIYPSQDEENSLFFVELIIDPMISIFEDYKGNNCMAINLGYNYYYDESIEELRMELHTQLDVNIGKSLMVFISTEYHCSTYGFGYCQDSSYVAYFKRKEFGLSSIQAIFGTNDELDKYYWIIFLNQQLVPMDSAIIYSIFPKDKITLPSKEIPRVIIDPSKLKE
ncbi:MAG: hypothetical protein ACFFA2_01885 [Promethearchaeota archaeon]